MQATARQFLGHSSSLILADPQYNANVFVSQQASTNQPQFSTEEKRAKALEPAASQQSSAILKYVCGQLKERIQLAQSLNPANKKTNPQIAMLKHNLGLGSAPKEESIADEDEMATIEHCQELFQDLESDIKQLSIAY